MTIAFVWPGEIAIAAVAGTVGVEGAGADGGEAWLGPALLPLPDGWPVEAPDDPALPPDGDDG